MSLVGGGAGYIKTKSKQKLLTLLITLHVQFVWWGPLNLLYIV